MDIRIAFGLVIGGILSLSKACESEHPPLLRVILAIVGGLLLWGGIYEWCYGDVFARVMRLL
jgi:hypothetical protein